jgi:hypothetical protein
MYFFNTWVLTPASVFRNVSAISTTVQIRVRKMRPATGMPDFSRSKRTKTGKIYQMTTNYTKMPYIIAIGRKIFQLAIKYNNISHSGKLVLLV